MNDQQWDSVEDCYNAGGHYVGNEDGNMIHSFSIFPYNSLLAQESESIY